LFKKGESGLKRKLMSDEVLTVIEQAVQDRHLGRQLLSVLGKIQRKESLSNDEFREFREILRLERQYRDVSRKQPTGANFGLQASSETS
jgi:hypothetical protein